MSKPRLLDLFCGAGGAAMGYSRAGFEVVGVDIEPQPHYPFEFIQCDALNFLLDIWEDEEGRGAQFDAVHASPPCHDHTTLSPKRDGTANLLCETIELLKQIGLPWVCENVVGKSVKMDGWYFTLCGSQFGMQVRRHRRFGASFMVMPMRCAHSLQGRPYTITGNGGGYIEYAHSLKPDKEDFWKFMNMPWMEGKDQYGVTQALPPDYTEFIGAQLLQHLGQPLSSPVKEGE